MFLHGDDLVMWLGENAASLYQLYLKSSMSKLARLGRPTMGVSNSGAFRIGNELPVYRLGYGAMQLCGPNAIGWCEDHDAPRRLLNRVKDLGINFVDTAVVSLSVV